MIMEGVDKVMVCFKVLSWYLPGGIEENYEFGGKGMYSLLLP